MIQELGNDLIPIFAITCTTIFLVIWILAATVDSLYKTSRTANLKQQLIDRGYSSSEIARIVGEGSSQIDELPENPPVPPVKQTNGFPSRQRTHT